MNKEMMARVLNPILRKIELSPGAIRGPGNDRSKDARIMSGTTILFFRYADGLIFAGDRKMVMGGYTIKSQESIKIHPVFPHVACGFAGLVSDGQYILDFLKNVNNGFFKEYGYPLSVKGQAECLRSLLIRYRHYVNPWGLEIDLLLGGLNIKQEFEGFELTGDGCLFPQDYCAMGSGWSGATQVLNRYRGAIKNRKLSMEEGMRVAVEAIYNSGETDIGSSPIQVAVPTVAIITVNGFQYLEEAKIAVTRDEVLAKAGKDNG